MVTLLPQDSELNPHTDVVDWLVYLARLQGLSRGRARHEAERVLDSVLLRDRARARIRELSHGMRRRVAVAQALLGNARLVLLDEPMSGLDPELVVRVREVLAAERGKRTLVVSSHNLAELEALCDHCVMIHLGRCHASGALSELTRRGIVMRYRLEARIDVELDGFEHHWSGETLVVEGKQNMPAADINARVLPVLTQAGARLVEVHQGLSLEAAYLARRGHVVQSPQDADRLAVPGADRDAQE
jgi:ABC-type multidrug transport system ATPase subunit